MKKKILIFGSGNQARVVSNLLYKKFRILGYLVTKKTKQKKLNNKNVYLLTKGKFSELTKNKKCLAIIAVGDNKIRKKIFDQTKKLKLNIEWISMISKKAIISNDVKIGKGSLVMPGCIINNGSVIKDHCIINTGSIIEHDNFFDNFSSCGPRVVTGGNVQVNKNSYIGIGSVVKEKIKIYENVIIGGNSFVNKNCKKNSLYYGNPIKLVS